jgi:DNA-binding LacI/PurR family transcriptional regulator
LQVFVDINDNVGYFVCIMTVTLKEIAGLVDVSQNTVSRALKGKSDIGKDTTRRVREVARTLGYRPNMVARSLVSSKSYMIGLAVTDMENPNRTELVSMIREEAETRGYHILLSGISLDGEEQVRAVDDLIGRQVDGLVIGSLFGIASERPVWSVLEQITKNEKPLVVFGSSPSRQLNMINLDYYAAGALLVKHLSGLGYKRIACFGSVETISEMRNSREKGYYNGMEEAGLKEYIQLISCDTASLANGRNDIRKYLFDGHSLPEAIIAHNDMQAIGIIKGLKEAGVSVPRDIAVVGFDSIEMGEYMTPALTSVGWPKRLIAESIISMLFEGIESNEIIEPEEKVFKPKIIIKESCGSKG